MTTPAKSEKGSALTPEIKDQILRSYAADCRRRFLAGGHDERLKTFARTNPDQWEKNLREGQLAAIERGDTTWGKIAELANFTI